VQEVLEVAVLERRGEPLQLLGGPPHVAADAGLLLFLESAGRVLLPVEQPAAPLPRGVEELFRLLRDSRLRPGFFLAGAAVGYGLVLGNHRRPPDGTVGGPNSRLSTRVSGQPLERYVSGQGGRGDLGVRRRAILA
jgi:hypothetical protein